MFYTLLFHEFHSLNSWLLSLGCGRRVVTRGRKKNQLSVTFCFLSRGTGIISEDILTSLGWISIRGIYNFCVPLSFYCFSLEI